MANATIDGSLIQFRDKPPLAFTTPVYVFTTRALAEVCDVITAAHAAARAGNYVIGFVTYEAAPAFDSALRVRQNARMPLAWFAAFDAAHEMPVATAAPAPQWSISTTSRDFCANVERIRAEIAAGRTYQVNLTTRFTAQMPADPLALHFAITQAQGNGYHAYIDTGDFVIACASPELFFEQTGRRIRTRPMKGTRARGRFAAEDDALRDELEASEKDRAENLMIVDLLRNDLGRIAVTGSVEVASLFDVEQFRTVHQMTSTVTAELRDDVQLTDIFRAMFPCGSVTGAPKVSTMQLITELEDGPREVYCGAIGMIEPGGENATFNVPIRTVWMDRENSTAVYGSGAGITYDSDPQTEYEEVLAKAAVLTESWPQFELLETMRIDESGIVRMDRHIERLLSSARYFGIPADEARIRGELAKLLNGAALSDGAARIRLLVAQDGTTRVELLPLDTPAHIRVALAQTPISSRDRFLFHKTTNRAVYDSQQRAGYFDVLLWNEREEITEFTRGNVVLEIDGERVTPALECGLLPGVLRQQLLEAGEIIERVVVLSELQRATRLWFVNSLRGEILVEIPEPAAT